MEQQEKEQNNLISEYDQSQIVEMSRLYLVFHPGEKIKGPVVFTQQDIRELAGGFQSASHHCSTLEVGSPILEVKMYAKGQRDAYLNCERTILEFMKEKTLEHEKRK